MNLESLALAGILKIEPETPTPRPPVDHARLNEQLRTLLEHEKTFPPGRASRYDEKGNEVAE